MSGLYEFICGIALGGLLALVFFSLGMNVQRMIYESDRKEEKKCERARDDQSGLRDSLPRQDA